ncbi:MULTISPECIES: tRNA 2-thiouridine(34) synthase MnmA [Flectobacillus]|jgi:tRNA-specific 2-thiouridylase|uniref:tRNA-specific 2-thiouridylase MnmA n=2 Tax=Flectobacillus TaxID=101 RepID=A0ABT6YLA5_9BACT|nr:MULTISPECIES: tRNA 2-thiouridine(34) synthase MnmA [Flectobacillus]NBA74139.1 tRNA 2-thiouridine(34) synthase MnmA [Emticicia sp. ODNR4P]MDI9859574.1 tRNA 2-thiouridine(34) synthase MnmA [Flectobacillus roseus]MDI9864379.1 tRNA 2-thiouridine(34) synthase MnmA [Flectobacillus longus]MDI9868903.1 tRNA 2-thiouridine(34) synthase MnmA [Flectobacillus roseus]PAC29662.1 tRNA 2-thiouridine(34) synthase MnmA [Flectobacillus sp. BAB-3569]
MSKHGRILVAMSGGIDSSVAAVMLHEQGYEVVGMTMKTWDYASSGGTKKETGCCSLDSINDARNIAVELGFPHYILDIREEFGDYVINHFTGEYLEGRTPNPCVMCNTHIKWDALLRRADKLDCEFIATGHYANIREENSRFVISKGVDTWKDQSYVLWGVSQESLSRTKLPLGHLTKNTIREMAKERGFMDLVNKSESYEICFVPDNDYRGFLKRRVEGLEDQVRGGNFVDTSGKVLGKHEGYPFYTIGQRKGLGIALGYPAFVTEIRKETNEVVLGRDKDLERDGMWVGQLNLSKYASIPDTLETITKVRYKDQGTPAKIIQEGEKIRVDFHQPVSGIAPGQAAVFYEGDDVVGGGWISRSFKQDATSGIYAAEMR